MGNRRRKRLNPKYAALSWNVHHQRKEVQENSVMIEQLRLEQERQAQLKAEEEAEALRLEEQRKTELKAKQEAELKDKVETPKAKAPAKKKTTRKTKTIRKTRTKKV